MWLPKSCHMDRTVGILSTGEFSRREALLHLRLGASLRGKAVAMRQGRKTENEGYGKREEPLVPDSQSHFSGWQSRMSSQLTNHRRRPTETKPFSEKESNKNSCKKPFLLKARARARADLDFTSPLLSPLNLNQALHKTYDNFRRGETWSTFWDRVSYIPGSPQSCR